MEVRRDADAVLLDLVSELFGLLDVDELLRGLMDAMPRAVPATWVAVNEVGPERVMSLVEPPLERKWIDLFAELAHENPIYQRWLRTRDGRAYRFSDVTTREELEVTRLYREVYAPLGINHQIVISLPSEPDRVLAVVLSRRDRDFSDEERDLLNRSRPLLIQAYRNAVAYSKLRDASVGGIESALVDRGLTSREAEVLRHVAFGGSNRDVAARLGVSDRTVQKHLERCFRKLGVSTRSAAASRAWQLVAE
jgi:DNA-binding NarL/FixJ family response regulator